MLSCRLIEKAHNKIKTTWNITKHASGKLQRMEQIPQVLMKYDKVNDPQKIVDAFTTLFLNITENLHLHQDVRGDAISFLHNAFPTEFPDFKIIPTIETEIKSITNSLKAKILQIMMG
jgi:hypothetical protein